MRPTATLSERGSSPDFSLSLKTVLVGVRSSVVYPGASLSVWALPAGMWFRLVVHWESVNVFAKPLFVAKQNWAVQQSCTLLVAPFALALRCSRYVPNANRCNCHWCFTWLTSPWRGVDYEAISSHWRIVHLTG